MISLDELQSIIFKNKINNAEKLKKFNLDYFNDYLYYFSRGDNIIFHKTFVESAQEYRLIKNLVKYGIINITTGFYFENFIKNTRPYRFDILLDDYDTIIEVNGKQHFNNDISKDYWKNWRSNTQEDDIIKKKFAESKGYRVLYFTEYVSTYQEFGYFDKVFTNIEDLILNGLGLSLEINPNFRQDFEELSVKNTKELTRDQLVNKIQKFIIDNKITKPAELKIKKPGYLNYLYLYNLRDDIVFFNEKSKSYNYRDIKTVEDINKIVFDNKIVGNRDLRRSKFSGLSQIAKYYNWKISYYRGPDVKIPTKSLTVSDIIEYISYHRITDVTLFKEQNSIYYNKAKREGWLIDIQYYKED